MAFDGVDDTLLSAAFAAAAGPDATIAIVYKSTAGSGLRALLIQPVGSVAGAVGVLQNEGTSVRSYLSNPGSSYTIRTRTTTAATVYRSISIIEGAVGATGVPRHYLDGVDGGSYVLTSASNTPALASATWALGSINSVNSYFDGSIAEVFVYSRSLTAGEAAVFDAWLAARYSL
jgi:hypothetical protein